MDDSRPKVHFCVKARRMNAMIGTPGRDLVAYYVACTSVCDAALGVCPIRNRVRISPGTEVPLTPRGVFLL